MFEWIRRLGRKTPPPWAGVPGMRREKTYSAQSGFAYVYFYEGFRVAQSKDGTVYEYVYTVSSNRKSYSEVSVLVPVAALKGWEQEHHSLSASERRAIAKLALLQAFDERRSPAEMKHDVVVRQADAEAILERLGVD